MVSGGGGQAWGRYKDEKNLRKKKAVILITDKGSKRK